MVSCGGGVKQTLMPFLQISGFPVCRCQSSDNKLYVSPFDQTTESIARCKLFVPFGFQQLLADWSGRRKGIGEMEKVDVGWAGLSQSN